MKYIFLLILLILTACNESKTPEKTVVIASTNYPVKWSIDYISGGTVNNLFLIPEDIDPAFWEPADEDILKLSEVDRVFLNGATNEKWLATRSLTNYFDSSKTFMKQYIMYKGAAHVHDGKMHTHNEIDFNIWLDFELYKTQATEITGELLKIIKKPKVDFKANLKSLTAELDELKKEISAAAGDQKRFLASHPVYNYLARSHGWEVQNFHWEPEEMPADEEWSKLDKALEFSKYMLWESDPSKEILAKLKEKGVTPIVFRTCGNIPPSGDFVKEMKKNIENLKKALEK